MEILLNVEDPKCQFISSVCIAYCLVECHVSHLRQAKFLYPLLTMLQVKPNESNGSCPNVEYLLDITNKNLRLA